jgi:hypothetical protein
MVAGGWVEARNPIATRVTLGFARLNPTYANMISAVLSVNQAWPSIAYRGVNHDGSVGVQVINRRDEASKPLL